LVFRPDGVEFACGIGESFSVWQWSGGATGDPSGLMAELAREFELTGERLWLSRVAAEEWLGRSW
jgi:hypothetical protein